MNPNTGTFRRSVASMLIVANLCLSSGCATLAHRSTLSGRGGQTSSSCRAQGEVCPWLIGDALLLLAGVVPGVIAFVVDFATGAWRHDAYAQEASPSDGAVVVTGQVQTGQ